MNRSDPWGCLPTLLNSQSSYPFGLLKIIFFWCISYLTIFSYSISLCCEFHTSDVLNMENCLNDVVFNIKHWRNKYSVCRHLKNIKIMLGFLVVVLTSVIDRILRKPMIFLFTSSHFLNNFFSLIIDETCEYEIVVGHLIKFH